MVKKKIKNNKAEKMPNFKNQRLKRGNAWGKKEGKKKVGEKEKVKFKGTNEHPRKGKKKSNSKKKSAKE